MIRSIPEGVSTVNAEGAHIRAAVTSAAGELGVTPAAVQFTIDKAWFKNQGGGSQPRDTVKIIAWVRDAEEVEAASDAETWLTGLVERMGFEGTVGAEMRDGGVIVLKVNLKDRTPHFVGRRGVTLQAIRHLLEQSVGADYPDKTFQLDVADNRPRRDDDDRGERRGRGDRDDRRGRGRDRDRGRGRDRDRDRDRGGDRDEANAARLGKMARNIAKRVRKTGEAEVVRKELNSYDRRVVHMAIADMDGVGSRSLGDGSHKQIEIFKEGGDDDSVSSVSSVSSEGGEE